MSLYIGGSKGWSNAFSTAGNIAGWGSKKIPIVGAVITTSGVAIGIANAKTADEVNLQIANGALDAMVLGHAVVNVSGLKTVGSVLDAGAKFNNESDYRYKENSLFGAHMNRIKDLD